MKVYGIEHILYMLIMTFIIVVSLILIRIYVPKDKIKIPIKILAIIGLVLMIIYRIVVSKSRSANFIDFIPDTFCSMMGFILPLTVLFFKPSSKIYQYAIFSGFIGGFLTFVYPDFLVYFDNIFNIHPFTGLLYHTLMMYIALLAVVTGYFVPSFNKWCSVPIGLAFMVVFAVFGNSVLGQSNNMYLNSPILSGTGLTWYVVGILFILLYTILLQIYEMCTLKVKDWSIVKLFRHKNLYN